MAEPLLPLTPSGLFSLTQHCYSDNLPRADLEKLQNLDSSISLGLRSQFWELLSSSVLHKWLIGQRVYQGGGLKNTGPGRKLNTES